MAEEKHPQSRLIANGQRGRRKTKRVWHNGCQAKKVFIERGTEQWLSNIVTV